MCEGLGVVGCCVGIGWCVDCFVGWCVVEYWDGCVLGCDEGVVDGLWGVVYCSE